MYVVYDLFVFDRGLSFLRCSFSFLLRGRRDVVLLISSYIDIWPFTDLCVHVGHGR